MKTGRGAGIAAWWAALDLGLALLLSVETAEAADHQTSSF